MPPKVVVAEPLEAQLREVWIETGRAGVEKVYDKAVKKGLAVTRKQVQEFVKGQASAQVFQPRAKSDGRVVATRAMMTWQIDVMDMKQFDAKANKGFKFVLVAVDVFDRTMKAAPMKTKTPEETLRVFRTFTPLPKEVDSDHGQEFKGVFDEFLKSEDIGHREKDPRQQNALAVSDAAMRTLRTSMAKDMADSGSGAWVGSMKTAVNAYNNTGHSHLLGSEPSDVKESKALTYELRAQAGEDMKHNKELHDDKAFALKNAGAFRTMRPRNTWARAHQPSWGDEIHKVDRFVGPDVIDTEGNRFPVKLVLPVKASTTPAEVPKELTGGRPAITGLSVRTMRPFATTLRRKLVRPLALQVAGRQMNAEAGFKAAMSKARLVGIGSFRRFVQLFPDLLQVEGAAPRQQVRRA